MSRRLLEVSFPLAVCGIVVLSVLVPLAGASPSSQQQNPAAAVDFSPGSAATDVTAPEKPGVATVDNRTFESVEAALDAAEPGATVVLEGRFTERVVVESDDLHLVAGDDGAVLDGGESGRVLTVAGNNVTVTGLWIRHSGFDVSEEDSGIFVDGNGTTLRQLRITDTAFGIWVDGVDDVTISDVRIEGRDQIFPVTDRGNGIHLYDTDGTTVRDSEITAVRDGIYFSWASNVLAENNSMWNARYGVHYMYSDNNQLRDNVAVNNGVGFALMVSNGLEVTNNTAIRNRDTSGHGILAKDIEDSTISGNVLTENRNGLYLHNGQDNRLTDNLFLANDIGVHVTGGTSDQLVAGNSFVENHRGVHTNTQSLHVWNGSEGGNYWSAARTTDLTGDGISETRYRPAGVVEHLIASHPQAAVLADSPAFEVIRLAESSFPVLESPGIVDEQPMTEPQHDWKRYAN